MKKKTIALALVLVMVFGATLGGTFAYLTSTDTVTNTFTVGNVQIKLDEAKVNLYGEPVDKNGKTASEATTEWTAADRVKTNEYKLIPGHEYTKDPTVTVLAKSESSYIRMLVTVTYSEDADEVFVTHNYQGWFNFDNQNWTAQPDVKTTRGEGKITRTYEFRYYATVDGYVDGVAADVELPALFTKITVPDGISNDDLAKLADLKITVEAHAIQADGFNDAADAWSKF